MLHMKRFFFLSTQHINGFNLFILSVFFVSFYEIASSTKYIDFILIHVVSFLLRSINLNACYQVLDSDKPSTVDLMEFLLSYAQLAADLSENTQIYTRVETSVRKLFSELAKSKGNSLESVATTQKQFSETYKQASRSFGERIEMKRGDWICPR